MLKSSILKEMMNPTVILIFARYRTYLSICCAIFSKGKLYHARCPDMIPYARL